MNQKLQQAMAAAQSGKSREAQVLLTQVLSEEPEEVQAWFLLSHLVESKQKQLAYLKKVVELDPGHEKAVERLSELEMSDARLPAVGTAEPEEPISGTLPDWVTAVDEESGLEATVFSRSPLGQEDVPPVPSELFTDEPSPGASAGAPSIPSKREEVNVLRRKRARLTYALVGLVMLAAIVFIALLYFIFTSL